MTGNGLEQALEDAKLPEYVVSKRLEVGLDSTGENAAWVWIILPDETELTPEQTADLRDRIRACLAQADESVWPSVRFRTESEQVDLDQETAKK